MKTLLLMLALVFTLAIGVSLANEPYPLGGCNLDEYDWWVADGGYVCDWVASGNYGNPTWTYDCVPTGTCYYLWMLPFFLTADANPPVRPAPMDVDRNNYGISTVMAC